MNPPPPHQLFDPTPGPPPSPPPSHTLQKCRRWGGGPQRRLHRRLEGVAKAVGGGYCRLQMPLRLALGVRGTVAGHRLGALEGGRGEIPPPLPMHRWGRGEGGTSPPFQCITWGGGGARGLSLLVTACDASVSFLTATATHGPPTKAMCVCPSAPRAVHGTRACTGGGPTGRGAGGGGVQTAKCPGRRSE